MHIGRTGASALLLFLLSSAAPAAPGDLKRELAFECEHAGKAPKGWWVSLRDGARVVDRDVHGGKWCVLIERGPKSARGFTALGRSLPVDFRGRRVQLRGFLRTEGVEDYAGLWLRQDGEGGMLALDNMRARRLRGTTEWTEYRIDMVLRPGVRALVFGALLSGEGKVWVDDLALSIDGKHVADVPKAERPEAAAGDSKFAKGSGVAAASLTPVQIRNLTALGKVWGFLKYHHRAVTAGKHDWDEELFGVLPAVLAAKDSAAGNAALLAWCRRVGEVEASEPAAREEAEAHLRPDLDWIRDEKALGKELSAWLGAVWKNRHRRGDQHYVSFVGQAGNPRFRNESAYRQFAYPDAGFRILALYRFWNAVEYWFPYRDVIGEDWDGVLAGFLPRLVDARDAGRYKLALLALIARVHDTHANLWSSVDTRPPGGKASLPVAVRFLEGKAVIVAKNKAPKNLEVGDVILAVDGTPVDELVRAWSPFYAASNEPTRLRDIARSLTRGHPGKCRLRIERDGKERELVAERTESAAVAARAWWFHDRPGDTFQKLSPDVGYLKLSSVKQQEIDKYVRLARGTKGLVIDIRNYPSAFVVWTLGPRLVREPTEFVRFTRGDPGNPGTFRWGPPLVLRPQAPGYEGRVVILVDEVSQSQAEYTTMAFRVAPGAVVVGSTTAGADGNVSPLALPGGLSTMFSGLGVFYPDKKPTQRVGIVPDVEVRPTVAGIRAGRDEVLEAGIRRILGEEVPDADIIRMARRE